MKNAFAPPYKAASILLSEFCSAGASVASGCGVIAGKVGRLYGCGSFRRTPKWQMTVSMLSSGLRNLRPCCASQACILAIEARPTPLISESSRLVCRDMISGRKTARSAAHRTTNDAYGAFVIN
ncbi:hypothetical protein V1286_004182 [Bradyrhizobium algeriense]|uniref:Uncharacterized protein n=1 Tax=Bradyrhizobium algeriense TaxID=634784 RepID=A0ABU8BDL8_9BRAD